MAGAGDIPHKGDVVIDGKLYLYADSQDERAIFGLTPPFIARTSVQSSASGQPGYGDSDTEFFQTFTQKDWSKGEGQRFQGREDDDKSRFWRGTNLKVDRPGKVNIGYALNSLTFGASVNGISFVGTTFYVAGTTNLYSTTGSTAPASEGAHGAGSSPATRAITNDGEALYIAGTSKVRKFISAAFSDFAAATGAYALAFLNNTLYGLRGATADFVRWDTAGALTSLFTWKRADGTAITTVLGRLVPYGGKMLIVRTTDPPSLWLYDGTAPALIATFDGTFLGDPINVAVVNGTVFIGLSTDSGTYPAVYYYANGSIGELWRADSQTSVAPLVAAYGSGLAFTDPSSDRLMFYNPVSGGVSAISDVGTGNYGDMVGTRNQLLITRNGTAGLGWDGSDTVASSGSVTTSLIDFDSSLTKAFRGITVEWDDDPTDSGATVDISYRVGDVDGSYTSLQTSAVSGTEYNPNTTGKSISVKVTLNKSGSTYGPTLKRIKIRAVPLRDSFRDHTYMLNLAGRDGEGHLALRDGSQHNKDGEDMLADLRASAAATSPITVIDETGSFSAVIDKLEAIAVKPRQYIARVRVRGV
jgi:hypothetical protein